MPADDDAATPAAAPGQYLTLRVRPDDGAPALTRSYSLSTVPDDHGYRISVKREGAASRYLHDRVKVGDVLEVAAPRGDFVLRDGAGPVVLISAGVGATPVLAMLHALVTERSAREVWWLHGARNRDEHAFAAEVDALLATLPGAHRVVAYSRPDGGAGNDLSGRLDGAALDRLGVPTDADHYICGPEAFMRAIGAALAARGVAPERIATEVFGAVPTYSSGIVKAGDRAPHAPDGPAGRRAGRDLLPQQPRRRVGRPLPQPARLRRGLRRAGRLRLPQRGLPQLREQPARGRRRLPHRTAGAAARRPDPRLLHPARLGADARPLSGYARSATSASFLTRPASSHSTHSRWAASSSASARRPICAVISAASAAYARTSACAVARCARLWSSCHVTTSPARSSDAASASSGVSQTVSGSGIAARSAVVSGGPSSSVKAKRPPGRSAAPIARDQRVLVLDGEHRLEQEHDVERAARQRRRVRDREAAGQVARLLAGDRDGARAEVHAQVGAAQLPREEPPGPGDAAPQVEHPDPGADAGPRREVPDLAGGHEALLPDELAGGVRRRAGALQGLLERRAVVLPHRDGPNAVRKRSRNAAIGQTGACGSGSIPSCQSQPAIRSITFGSWAMTEIGTSWLAPWPVTSVAG